MAKKKSTARRETPAKSKPVVSEQKLGSLTTEELRQLCGQVRSQIYDRENGEKREANQKLIGKCYRYRNNYGGDSKPWWLYQCVTGVGENGELTGIAFQNDGKGRSTHEVGHLMESVLGEPITRAEFTRQYRMFLKRLG